jgi:regulator of sigma E protease
MEDPPDIVRMLLVVLGIGLVIFVHELGHYLAARLCGVRVETFSLGFGPRLLWKRIGPTLYQVALVPLGGFCRMAGEERRYDGLPPARDELPAKTVGQRFFIYSGGVLMNLLFGLVVFPILFRLGVPFTRPIIGDTIPGGAAWHARLPEGCEVVSVNGRRVFDFGHILNEVALGGRESAVLHVRTQPDGTERSYTLEPEHDALEGLATIGVRPGFERDPLGHILVDVAPGSPAERAGVRSGDRLIEVLGGLPGFDAFEQIALQARGDQPLHLRLVGARGTYEAHVPAEPTKRLLDPRVGIAAPLNRVLDVRDSELVQRIGLQPEDRLISLQGQPVRAAGDLASLLQASTGPLELTVRRGEGVLTLSSPALDPEQKLALCEDIALASDADSTEIVVQPGEAAEQAGLRSGDRVLQVDGTDTGDWEDVRRLVERAGSEGRPAAFRVARPGASEHLTLEVLPVRRPAVTYGLSLRQAEYVYRAQSLPDAVLFGFQSSWRFLEDSWLMLKRMLTREVSPRNMGGIITISAVSYSLTEHGWVKLFFFLCLLSINLAFLNVLPIPVLDGGHLFFLIIEKLKGSPVSLRTQSYSQAVGVVLLLSIMVYVTYNDLVRWVFTN